MSGGCARVHHPADGCAIRWWQRPDTASGACRRRPPFARAPRPRINSHYARLLHARFVRRELIDRRAELAGHHHLAVLDHVGAVVGREACSIEATASREQEHCARNGQRRETPARRARETADTAAARRTDPDRSVRHPRPSRSATGPRPRRRPRRPRGLTAALRRIAGMQIGLPRPLRRLGQKLQQHAAGAPAMLRAVPPPRHSSPTASRTRVGICSERRKYSCAASSRLPPSSATSP